MNVLRPKTLDQALAELADHGDAITPIAGGTDLLVDWPLRDTQHLTLLDLSALTRPLRYIHSGSDHPNGDGLELGGLTTYWDTIQSKDANAHPLLAQAARTVGAIQIQTRGTWAGNIANGSPAADGVPVLLAYDASLTLASAAGARRVRLSEYFTGYKQSVRRPDELITAIHLPPADARSQWFCKVGARRAQAIAKVNVAMVQSAAGWRVAAGSVAPFVCRCKHLEQALDAGTAFKTPQDVQSILTRDIAPIDDIRSTAEYRLRVLSRVIFHHLTTADRPST